MKTTIVLADDHEFVRYALAGYASTQTGFEVVASVQDAQTAVSVCARLQPDLALIDLDMPGRDPLSAIADIRAACSKTKVVLLATRCSDSLLAQVMRTRAHGCLLKGEPLASIFESLRRIARGECVYSPDILQRIPQNPEPGATRFSALTPRELEVLRYIGRGYNNDQMAGTMSLSKRTVERHVARLMDALAIRERANLQRFAIEHGVAC